MAVCSLIIAVNVLILWGCWGGHRVTQNHSSIIIAAKLGFWFGFDFAYCSLPKAV